jgi:DnaK suppressor protein
MDAINNQSVMEAALRGSRNELVQLEKAMKSIDDENFGKCRNCKKEIHIKRLMLMPGSKHCMQCAK